jgi:hypothetical protein
MTLVVVKAARDGIGNVADLCTGDRAGFAHGWQPSAPAAGEGGGAPGLW